MGQCCVDSFPYSNPETQQLCLVALPGCASWELGHCVCNSVQCTAGIEREKHCRVSIYLFIYFGKASNIENAHIASSSILWMKTESHGHTQPQRGIGNGASRWMAVFPDETQFQWKKRKIDLEGEEPEVYHT